MNKQRKTSHILNVFQYDADGHVVLPASLALGIAPTGEDNSGKVPTTAWVRSIVGGALTAYAPTSRTITINGTSYDLSSNRAWSIDTGVMTASAGLGISVSLVNQNLNIVNTGILTASSGAGISLSVVNQNLNVVNTGILTASAGLGISLSVVNQNLNVINTGILTASAGSGISLSVVDQNLNVINTGVLTASAGAGISLSIVGGNLNVVNTITNNNQLTNGAGYITSSALTGYATETYVGTAISNLVDAAPGTLDTLNELAAALGDDPNFATTVSTSIGTKVPQARTITINGTSYDLTANRSWTINSMVYPSAGIALSTGTAWGTSITDNSANWNTAYGWGNHASAGYAASSHTHSIANVTGLQTALDGKQASGSYAASVHTHAISDVTGLQTALDGKQASLGYTPYNNSNPAGYISSSGSITGDAGSVGGISASRIVYGDNSTATTYISNATLDGALKSGFYTVGSGGIPNATSVNFVLHTAYYGVGNLAGFDLACNDSTTSQFYLRPATGAGKGAWQTIVTNSGTWGISITGNAATLGGYGPNQTGGAYNIVQRDANGYIQNSYFYMSGGGSERNSSGLGYIAGFNSSDYYVRSYNSTAVASFLGLGSMAYASTGSYLPLSGGTVTGKTNIGTGGSTNGGIFNVTGGTDNQMNISHNSSWGLLLGYCNESSPSGYHGPNHAAIINVQDAPLHLGSNNSSVLRIVSTGASILGNTVLHAGNYNSYSPTLIGGGASGTWGINISGTAAVASIATDLNAADGTQINFNNVTNTDYSTMTFMSRAWSAVQGANGLAYTFTTHTNNGNGGYGAFQIYYGESGYVYAPTSFRAPIFYDSNNTNYYVDPDGTSVLSSSYIGGHYYGNNNSSNILIKTSAASGDAGIVVQNSSGSFKFQVYGNGSDYGFLNGTWAGWDIRKTATGNLYLNGQSTYYYGSDTTYMYRVYGTADMRSPIYFDLEDTSYYLDPNSLSNLSSLRLLGSSAYASLMTGPADSSRTYADGNRKAIVINADYYPALYLNAFSGTNTTHGAYIVMSGTLSAGGFRQWTMGIANYNPGIFSIGYNDNMAGNGHYGIGDAWSGNDAHHGRLIVDTSGNTKIRGMLYINGTSGGISAGSPVIHAGNIGSQSVNYASSSGTTSQRSFDYLYTSSYLESGGAVYGTIFYDNNDRGYYLDPNASGISLRIAGSVFSDGSFATNGYGSGGNAAVGRVYGPDGAAYSYSGGGITGAIKIRLPIRNNDTMWSMKVRIYNYSTNQTSEYLLGNYAYSQGAWNYSATYLGGTSSSALTVRFGNEGGYDCVWIGETSTSWSYPVVSVMDFMGGYSNGSVGNWYSNWDISIVSSFGTVGASVAPNINFNEVYSYSYRGNSNVAGTGSASYHPSGIYSTGTNWLYGAMHLNGNNINGGGSIYGSDIYTTGGWFRNHTNNNGIYWSGTGWHLYPYDANDFYMRSGSNEASIRFLRSDGAVLGYVHCASDFVMGFLTSGRSWRFRVDNSGNAIASGDVTAYSDKRLKSDITPINDALQKVLKLNGVSYKRIDLEDKSTKIGFIAQDVKEIVPEVVSVQADTLAGINDRHSIDYGKMVALLTEAIKEQQKQIEELQNKLDNVLSSR